MSQQKIALDTPATADWIKTVGWGVPSVKDFESYIRWRKLGSDLHAIEMQLRKDMTLPFWKAAPERLAIEATTFLRTRRLDTTTATMKASPITRRLFDSVIAEVENLKNKDQP